MKKVLIAIDYNPVSEDIVNAGYELAKQLDAEVCLIHIVADASYYEISYPEFMGYVPVSDIENNVNSINDARENAIYFLKQAAAHLDDPSVTTHLAEGKTTKSILNYAREWGADMIVLGTHSHSTLEKLFLGSIAASIIEETKIPIYLVPVKN